MRKERQSRRGGGTKRNSSQSEGESDGESRRGEKEKVEAVPVDRALVGNLIGEDHVNYVLMYNMLTGIRIGVSLSLLVLGIRADAPGVGLEVSGQNQETVDG